MDYEYQVAGQRVVLKADDSLIGVRYREPSPHSARAAFAHKVGAEFEQRLEIPNEKFTVLKAPATAGPMSASKSADAESGESGSGVARVTPVFRMGKVKVLATDRVLVGLKDPNEPVAPLLCKYRPTDIQSRGYGEYTVCLAEDVDPLEVAKTLSSDPKFNYAEPDFVNIGSDAATAAPADMLDAVEEAPAAADPSGNAGARYAIRIRIGEETITLHAKSPDVHICLAASDDTPAAAPASTMEFRGRSDIYLPRQYAATITKAREAWTLQRGNPAIRIAVLDEGVDTRHEDLRAAIAGSYDAADRDEFQEPNPWDGHGTACAGLAAAVPNNRLGIRGIGGGCSIIAVRIAYSERPGGPWVTANGGIADAIEWSWRNGADVLSNSWGSSAPSNAIYYAIDRARSYGRGGKGCVVVAAAGNDSGPVSFPASIANVLAVSASNEYDEFKSTTSRDGETWWGSNFGPQVSIAAPGVHNYTTDITGPSGYNRTGNYTPDFNGTSSSTPIVAGAAALLLSARPDLTESEVRHALCANADKVGATPYTGGRNDYFGFGRLNVVAALRSVMQP